MCNSRRLPRWMPFVLLCISPRGEFPSQEQTAADSLVTHRNSLTNGVAQRNVPRNLFSFPLNNKSLCSLVLGTVSAIVIHSVGFIHPSTRGNFEQQTTSSFVYLCEWGDVILRTVVILVDQKTHNHCPGKQWSDGGGAYHNNSPSAEQSLNPWMNSRPRDLFVPQHSNNNKPSSVIFVLVSLNWHATLPNFTPTQVNVY